MELKQVVQVDDRFQKSVNLFLDLENPDKAAGYIPTLSSLEVLRQYVRNIAEQTHNRANILIGPYGKGKSHLILLLLQMFQKNPPEQMEDAMERIQQVDEDTALYVRQTVKKTRPLLPVLVDAGEESLNQSFAKALYRALEREGLQSVTPDTYYSKAVDKIAEWKRDFPDTYGQLGILLQKQDMTVALLVKKLKKMDTEALHIFMEKYPLLTAGSAFEPMLVTKARELYQSVNEVLCQEYGYGGIYIIFDEFSKYIEGYSGDGFAADMKVIQDLCELADKSSLEQQLHITLIAHKSIREYGKTLAKERVDAFRGVEGRLKENLFVVSAKNNYELIRLAIRKLEPDFQQVYQIGSYRKLVEDSYHLPCYEELFRKEDYEDIVGYGCYPLTPAATYLLLRISEKIAQNERTIFTFIAGNQKHSLRNYIAAAGHKITDCAGADLVYDYFDKLLMESDHNAFIHNEWLKADYALSQVKNRKACKVIKALALILMVQQREQLPANDPGIRLAAGLSVEDYEEAKEQLLRDGILLYRYAQGTYTFKNNVGVDVEKEIQTIMHRNYKNLNIAEAVQKVSELDYILPKRYNQLFSMTRFYQYEYMSFAQFLALPDADVLFAKGSSDDLEGVDFADGKIVAILRMPEEDSVSEETEEITMLHTKIEQLGDDRIVVLYPEKARYYGTLLRRLTAVKSMQQDEQFITDNVVLEQELSLYEEDLNNEINVLLERDYLMGAGRCKVFHHSLENVVTMADQAAFNVFLSEVLTNYYGTTPKVNNESINREHISTQIRKARDKVLLRILNRESCEDYRTGTAPDATIYRAVMMRTGIADGQAMPEVNEVFARIHEFVKHAAQERQSFAILYQILQGEPYGVRRGVIPIFLAKVFAELMDMPVIYTNGKELSLDCNVLNNINRNPAEYELYVEVATIQKEQYLEGLEQLFSGEQETGSTGSRLEQIVLQLRRWYRSLPQCVKIADYEHIANEQYHLNFGKAECRIIQLFNRKLQKFELNARDFLFADIPLAVMGDSGSMDDIAECVAILTKVKNEMDAMLSKMKQQALCATKEIFGGSKVDNINNCLKDWYDRQSEQAKSYLHNTQISGFMSYVEHLNSHDEEQIISKLSKLVIDVYVEDWNPDSLTQYTEAMRNIRMEIEGMQDVDITDAQGQNSIEFTNSHGQRVKKFFQTEDDSTSYFLKNAMEEAMDEFGDTLEVNQKVSVLVAMLDHLLS